MLKHNEFQTLGSTLRQYRENFNLSISELSRILKIDRTHLSKIENGHERPSLGLLNKLIWHYSLSGSQANELISLARHSASLTVISNKQLESDGRKEGIMEAKQNSGVQINIPNNVPVLYCDSVFMNSTEFGLTLDFAQTFAGSNQQNVVTRIGMSFEHASKMIEVLNKHLLGYLSKQKKESK